MDNYIVEIGSFPFNKSLKEEWKAGKLHPHWVDKYPNLFDEDDIRLAENQSEYGYHFVEWLSTILLYNSTGYKSLISKYEFSNHKKKTEIISKIFENGLPIPKFNAENITNTQYPDLLVYRPDFKDWFFCEVKGPGDRLSKEQRIFFEALALETNEPVRMIQLKELKI